MREKAKILLLGGLLMLLVVPVLAGCKKTADTDSAEPRIGILDLAKTLPAHPRYNELQKLEQEIAKVQADAARSANERVQSTAGIEGMNIAGPACAGFQQALDQQINARLAHKRSELEQVLESKLAAAKQEINQRMADYAKELDKTYQPEILSLQLKMQTVQMTPEEQDAIKTKLHTLQEERTQKLQKQQALLETEIRPRIEEEQKKAEEEFRQFHAQLLAEANSQMSEQQKVFETRRAETATGAALSAGEQKYAAELQVLQEQREKLKQIMMQEIKDAVARIAAREKLEVVIGKYRQNIRAVDITGAVMAEIKK